MSVTITGNINDLTGTAVTSNCYVRFWLRGCNGNQPRVGGAALIAPDNGPTYWQDFAPNGSGQISGTLYSNDVNISAGGQVGVTWYDVQVFLNGQGGSYTPYALADGTTFNLNSATPITTNPVVAAPTGDSTYARLDGGNTPFTAIIQFLQGLILGVGKVLGWGSVGTTLVDTGISRTAAKTLAVGNGTQGDATGTLALATVQVGLGSVGTPSVKIGTSTTGFTATGTTVYFQGPSIGLAFVNQSVSLPKGQSLKWSNNTADSTTVAESSLSEIAAGILAVGNGTNGDSSGEIDARTHGITGATSGKTSLVTDATASGNVTVKAGNYVVVGDSLTQTLTGKTLTGATSGNNVLVLNAQGAIAALTGNSADQVIYTFTLLANTVDTTSKGIRVSVALAHNSGTANPSVKININGVAAVTGSIGTTASQSVTVQATILRTASTTGGSMGINTNAGALLPFSQALTGLAWTSNQTITVTFNVANTDQMTGILFLVEQIQ